MKLMSEARLDIPKTSGLLTAGFLHASQENVESSGSAQAESSEFIYFLLRRIE